MSTLTTIDTLIREFEQSLGTAAVLKGADAQSRRAGTFHDTTIAAPVILRPRTTEEVAAILRRCNALHQPLVVHGGLTNLVHSAETTPEHIVVSLERMTAIEEIDPVGRTMTVQAGVPLQALQERAAAEGLMFALDLGARGSCQIGGNTATNAGGNRVIRYGMTRDNILGLEAVLADGTVVSSLNRMIKNNAGYDLKHLFIGSEGTLGVVTRLVLRLREAPVSQNTSIAACPDFTALTAFLKHMDRELGGTLSAFEVLWREFYTLVTTPPAKGRAPVAHEYPYYVLVESLGGNERLDAERFEAAMTSAFERELVADAAIARSAADRAAMWGLRDDVEQLFRDGKPFIFDVSLGIRDMEDYVAAVRAGLDAHWTRYRCYTFGHMGDGNLHFAVQVGDTGDAARRQVEACLYEPLARIGGSVSAEHGIGLEKKPYLGYSRSAAEIELMRVLKRTLDPNGILNRGIIFDT